MTSDQPFFVLQRNNVIYGKIAVPPLSFVAVRAMEGKANGTGSGITTMTRTIRTIPIIRTAPAVEVKVIPGMLKAGENRCRRGGIIVSTEILGQHPKTGMGIMNTVPEATESLAV